MLLILSLFPNKHEGIDGALQRVKQIDSLFINIFKVYFQLSARRYVLPYVVFSEKRVEIRAHLIWILLLVPLLICAKQVYIHSVFSIFRCSLLIKYFAKNKIIFDVHGVVPEEIAYNGNSKKAKKFVYLENIAVNNSCCIIGVTNKLLNHIINKYNVEDSVRKIVLPMFTFEMLSQDLNSKRDIDIIYAGGLQKWQNIDKLIKLVNRHQEKISVILTPDSKKISGVVGKNVYCGTATHSEVYKKLLNSKLGFICREDHLLNSVACPTKLVEYLMLGVVPIVDFIELGDFVELGYEYIRYEDILNIGFPDINDIEIKRKKNISAFIRFVEIIQKGQNKLISFVNGEELE